MGHYTTPEQTPLFSYKDLKTNMKQSIAGNVNLKAEIFNFLCERQWRNETENAGKTTNALSYGDFECLWTIICKKGDEGKAKTGAWGFEIKREI